jgi:hypothetical protein
MNKTFHVVWGESKFRAGSYPAAMDFFSVHTGYTASEILAIAALEVGHTWGSTRYAYHSVTRLGAPVVKPTLAMSPAQTVLHLLGDKKFKSATGATQMVGLKNGIDFHLPPKTASNNINAVRITQQMDDTYTLDFAHIRGRKIVPIVSATDVAADRLQVVFAQITGLVL